MAASYEPRPEDRFSFGLWTLGNSGADAFGGPVRKALSPVQIVHLLAEVGARGVNFHDNDLVPIHATADERRRIVAGSKKALRETGIVVPMATTNLFADPAFREGEVRVSGGGVSTPLWRQIMADVLNVELATVSTTEGAAYGAALLAGMGAGIWRDVGEASRAAVRVTGTAKPQSRDVAEYEKLRGYYCRLYPALKDTFHKLGGEVK